MKKLYRSSKNRFFAGVIGGLGEYFDIDSNLLRVLWLLILIFTGVIPGVIVYIISIFIIPMKIDNNNSGSYKKDEDTK
ncbi:MAG: PspC domain-containing protein [Candidatus Staskawiczbacteria bacterium]|nr:PspC domain-containing protein [Candidatus Staskawiczbacteria bacterium]